MDFANYFPIWNKLSPEHQQKLSHAAEFRSVKGGTVLHNGSLDCLGLLVIKSGQIRVYLLSEEGREVTLYRLFDRDVWAYVAENAVLKAGNEVSNALVSYNASAEKAELDGKRVKVMTKNVEDTKKLMESSSNTTYLEVISAQSNLLNAEIAEVTDQFNKMQAVVNLYQALGGGAN